jgi:hypothetical protein
MVPSILAEALPKLEELSEEDQDRSCPSRDQGRLRINSFGRRSMKVRLAKFLLVSCALAGPAALAFEGTAWADKSAGVSGSMPAYYDHQLLTINFFQLTTAQATLLSHNSQTNTIYMSDAGLPGGKPFIAVLDAIQGDGFNPLWAEVQVNFTTGNTPTQLFSDNDILAAAAAGIVTLTPSNELYRCSVIGKPISFNVAGAGTATSSAAAVSPTTTPPTWGALKASYR